MSDVPAILGGPAVRPQGPPSWPVADADIALAVEAALADGSWGKYHGGHCTRLEQALGAYQGVDHVLLCASGTSAVELALRTLQVGPGHEVLLAGYDYVGNFLGVHAVGAQPVLIDVRPDNWNLDVDKLAQGITKNTRAILASHLHGGVVPMRELMACAADVGVPVIEDAAQCPGAEVQGKKAGTWGQVGVLSFGGSKLLNAGRGGAMLTSDPLLFQRGRNQMLRGNLLCPLSELQAAVLLPQLAKLDERNATRRGSVALLAQLLAGIAGITPFHNPPALDAQPGYYKLGFQFDADIFGLRRDLFVAAMHAEGIALDAGFAALHVGRSPRRYRAGSPLHEAERAHHGALVLHHPVLLEEEAALHEIAAAFRKVQAHAVQLAANTAAG